MRGYMKQMFIRAVTLMTAALIVLAAAVPSAGIAADSAADETVLAYKDIPVDDFEVSELSPDTDTCLDYVRWWYSEWEDCRYIFLPSTADRSSLMVNYIADEEISLSGVTLVSGEMTSLLGEADEFDITVGDTDCGKLRIMQSQLGCIYISTDHMGLDRLDRNRALTETGMIVALNAEGGTEYSGRFEKLSAHGNSSWDYSKKKPYNLKLPQKEDLYGMGKAKKWVLLGNYLDHSMLRNRIAAEMANAAGMEYVPDTVFVDLYADGSYRGTYQLSERLQIQKNRVNIRDLEEKTEEINEKDLEQYQYLAEGAANTKEYIENSYKYYDIPNDPEDITGGYLMEFQQWNRYGTKAKSGFITSRGQAISLKGPEYASKAQVEYIRGFVQDMEDAIYSEDGYNSKGKHYSEYLDVDSLINAYLIQEISENVDSTYSSFYMWKDSDKKGDGRIHFGPVWDMDFTYGNFKRFMTNSDGESGFSGNPETLYTAYFFINGYKDSGRDTLGISWLGKMYKREDFRRRAASAYKERFEPFLNELIDGDEPYIRQMAEEISSSAEMSNARWHTYGGKDFLVFGDSSGEDFMGSVEILREFAEKRRNFLTKTWNPLSFVRGDVNGDGYFDTADLVRLKKWLIKAETEPIEEPIAADIYPDGSIDVFDLCTLERELLKQSG